jgi:GNAT superfamily N-acetyltransferase
VTAIRPATLEDLPRLVEMGVHFATLTGYAALFTVDPGRIEVFLRRLIEIEDGDVLVSPDDTGPLVGMCALMAYDHPFADLRMGSEIAWWVEPHARGRRGLALLWAAERWAQAHGCTVMQMVAPDAQVARLYEARGYTRVEQTFQRRL